jgi:hypothetical protein
MEFQEYMSNIFNEDSPNDPEKDIPLKPDKNHDPTKQRPGGSEPNKIDPTRIEQPQKLDPTRIAPTPAPPRSKKWTKVNSWDEALEKMKGVSPK